jgi:hypothetical protein
VALLERITRESTAAEPAPQPGLHVLARLGEALERLRGLDLDRIAPCVHEAHRDDASWSSVEAGLARLRATRARAPIIAPLARRAPRRRGPA